MKVSLEYLYHCCCERCRRWWSHADIEPELGDTLFCPFCGHLNTIEGIETFRQAARGACLTTLPDSQLLEGHSSKGNTPPEGHHLGKL